MKFVCQAAILQKLFGPIFDHVGAIVQELKKPSEATVVERVEASLTAIAEYIKPLIQMKECGKEVSGTTIASGITYRQVGSTLWSYTKKIGDLLNVIFYFVSTSIRQECVLYMAQIVGVFNGCTTYFKSKGIIPD